MWRLISATVLTFGICVSFAGAEDPKGAKTGLAVGKTSEVLVVARVKGGSLSSFMGFQEGDAFVSYSFNGTGKSLNTTDDLSELLGGKPGRHVVTLKSKDGMRTIAGAIGVKEDGKTLYFLPDRPKK
jgi:hypothetical protein